MIAVAADRMDKAAEVACPKCGAPPRLACVEPSGKARGLSHDARRRAHPAWDPRRKRWTA